MNEILFMLHIFTVCLIIFYNLINLETINTPNLCSHQEQTVSRCAVMTHS